MNARGLVARDLGRNGSSMRVLVTGGTGFIGRALSIKLIERGDTVTGLTRRIPEPSRLPPTLRAVRWLEWDPDRDGAWQGELAGKDAVVHLAGEQAVGKRYTAAVKDEILKSRVDSTARLVRGMAQAEPHERPRVFVCASGVGYYGGRDDAALLDESSPAGSDFLALVCVAWEGAAREAEPLGVRVVSARFGFVLGADGGALAKLVPIFKAFAGGPIGNGRQMMPWVHIDDVTAALLKAIDDATLAGPMNVTAPVPVSNADFSRALGRALRRPAVMPTPAFALKTMFGEGAEPLITGQAAVPSVLLSHGFTHRFSDLNEALRDLVSR